MLTNDEITRFYEALGVERINVLVSMGPGVSGCRPITFDANEIERLMPKITERYGRIETIHMLIDGKLVVSANNTTWRDTIAEAIAHWVLAQEPYFNEDDRPGRDAQ